jgi:hypothetical protein
LDTYESFVQKGLKQYPDASAAQVHDWLKETLEDLINVNAKTVFNFVLLVRKKYNIPKPFSNRDFIQIEELPFARQAQVVFEEYNMTTYEDKQFPLIQIPGSE